MQRTAEGLALVDVMMATVQTYFRLTAAGKRIGAVSPWGGGTWGFLRTLHEHGPRTVPQIARSRPVSRQLIQRIANELAEAGLVEFVDNPAHRRSKLVRLTAKGEAAFADLNSRVEETAERLAEGMDVGEVRTAARVLATLGDRLAAQ